MWVDLCHCREREGGCVTTRESGTLTWENSLRVKRAQQDLLDIIALPMGNFYSIVCWTVRSHGGRAADSPRLLWRPFHLRPNTRGTVGCVVCCVWPGSINDAQEEVDVGGVDLKNETGRRLFYSPSIRPEIVQKPSNGFWYFFAWQDGKRK